LAKFSEVFSTTAQVVLSLFLIGMGMLGIYLIVSGRSFLFAAYIATWLIHGFYLDTLVRRFSRLRQQMKALPKKVNV